MSEGYVEKEILQDVNKFIKKSPQIVVYNGSHWRKVQQNIQHLKTAFKDELKELGAGVIVSSVTSFLTGGAIALPGVLGFATAVVMNALKNKNRAEEKAVMQKLKIPGVYA
ncbi:MAG: hypothetical protein N4A43_03060 [Alphaproteobacteria bacterium]|jgi:hypothetical protein|nr:hypothetical protein [Alphaproteobacteria bacterium]